MLKYTIDDIKSGKLHVGMRVNENQLDKIHGVWFKIGNIDTPYGFNRVGDITEISFKPLKGFWDIIHNEEKTDIDEEDDILYALQAVGLGNEDDDIAGEIDKILGNK